MDFHMKIFRYFVLICVMSLTGLNVGICQAQNSEENENVITIENGERGLWSRDNSKQLRIEEIQSIGVYEGDDDYIFANIHDVAITPNGNLYICDWGDQCIKVYDKNGVFIRKFGREGEGPGEFRCNHRIEINKENQLYVMDVIYNRRISVFDTTGNFINSFQLPSSHMNEMKLKSTGEIIVLNMSSPLNDFSSYIFHFDEKGNVLKSYSPRNFLLQHKYGDLYSTPSLGMSLDEDLYCAFDYPYLIKIYRNEELIKIITRECDHFSDAKFIAPKGMTEKFSVFQSKILKIFCLPEGKFFTLIWDAGDDYVEKYESTTFEETFEVDYWIDLFDSEGHFLKSYLYDQDKYGRIIHIDSEGYVYTDAKDGIPMLVKYKFSFE